MPAADDLIRALALVPHPEGGWYRETYRAAEAVAPAALPPGYATPRVLATAIYYLLRADDVSALHRLAGDEVFHFYAGDPVEMVQLFPGGGGRVVVLGSSVLEGMVPQAVVPKGVWQGARLRPGGQWALMGTTMAPGFDFADYEAGRQEPLLAAYPAFREWVLRLTPTG